MLTVENLTAGYRDLIAVRDVSLTVREAEFVGVVGANAAGKSTLARAITGLIPVRAGRILWEGRPLTDVAPHRRPGLGLVMVPEGRALFGFMSVQENLEMGATNLLARHAVQESLARVYELFPFLEQRAREPARSLSGGQQQMLSIGRALMARPRLLILDEPSVGLAPKIVAEIYGLLRRIFSGRTSILLIEQDVRKCLRTVERAYVMARGGITLEGPAEALLHNDEVRRTYLGA